VTASRLPGIVQATLRKRQLSTSDEERRRNVEATTRQVNADVDAFLSRYAGIDQGFTADDLAEFVRSDRFDRRAADLALMSLKGGRRVHYLAGRWPPEPGPVDQG
jgi:hypothetical protein